MTAQCGGPPFLLTMLLEHAKRPASELGEATLDQALLAHVNLRSTRFSVRVSSADAATISLVLSPIALLRINPVEQVLDVGPHIGAPLFIVPNPRNSAARRGPTCSRVAK